MILPTEILWQIYQFCSFVDLLSIRRTCQSNKEIINHLSKHLLDHKFTIKLFFDKQFLHKEPSFQNVVDCLSHINVNSIKMKDLSFTIDQNILRGIQNWTTLHCLIRMKLSFKFFIEMIKVFY